MYATDALAEAKLMKLHKALLLGAYLHVRILRRYSYERAQRHLRDARRERASSS